MVSSTGFIVVYWLVIITVIVGIAFLVMAIIALIGEIRFRLERRRYQRARK